MSHGISRRSISYCFFCSYIDNAFVTSAAHMGLVGLLPWIPYSYSVASCPANDHCDIGVGVPSPSSKLSNITNQPGIDTVFYNGTTGRSP
mmetsp:Transcript_18783/g.28976  ORF Transcript_18783/g.28976 Transcript_18783/m.28976 type:complete len:90 (-) Transcript_18783:787-1056(-)